MKVAIVGGGISGLTAARLLHPVHDITIFDDRPVLGGNARTITVRERGRDVVVDAGVCVFFNAAYNGFFQILRRLGVKTERCDMSMDVFTAESGRHHRFDLNHPCLTALGAAVRPREWWLLREGRRFVRDARARLADPAAPDQTLDEYLAGRGYTNNFLALLVSSCMATWTVDSESVLRFPAEFVFRNLLELGIFSPPWRRGVWHHIPGSVSRYLDAIATPLRGRARLGASVTAVARDSGGVAVVADGKEERFDQVVFAIPGERALSLITTPTAVEKEVLGEFATQDHEITFTSDETLISKYITRPAAGFTYTELRDRGPGRRPGASVRVAFLNLTKMCRLPLSTPVYLWYQFPDGPRPAQSYLTAKYSTPVFTQAAVRAQSRHAEISGVNRLHFCGSGWTNGVHEGGVQSALAVGRWFGTDLDSLS